MIASSILFGMGTLVVSLALKFTPKEWVEQIPVKIDEDKMEEDDRFMQMYKKSIA